MKNKIGILVLTLILAFALAGCSSNEGTQTSGTKEYKDVLRVALEAQPTTLDPQMITGSPTKIVMRHVFETLVTLNSEFQPVPMLAESVDMSEDGRLYTFNLRKGVTFQNGKELKAEDVVASMNRWIQLYDAARNVMGDNAIFKEVDEYTVELVLEEPALGTLGVMATHKQFPAIMPKEIIDSAKPEGVTEFIGTGPFQYVEWKQDQYIHLKKYEDYKSVDTPADGLAGKKEALVDDLYFDIVTDPSTRLSGLQTGQYDVGLAMDTNNYEQLKSSKNENVYVYPIGNTILAYNKKQGAFADNKMRHAVNAAINAQEILEVAFGNEDLYKANSGYMSESQPEWYSDAGKEMYNQANPEKAKELLKEAGYNGEEIKFLTTRDDAYQYKGAVVIKEQLEKIGMNIKLQTVDWASYSGLMKDPSNYDMVTFGITLVTSPSQLSTLGVDRPGYGADPKISELLVKSERATSQEEAKTYWDEAQRLAWEDYLPITQIGEFNHIAATTNKVDGFTVLNGAILWNTKVSK
ncbi:ABC transporter substrate-binding protein [Bacillus sp. FJAT-22090]|uniref:ABC transporter substrate-binding protein n=1 Tax=Bacillus sp. FJAT-22090 TaxID=1581038 RepID=UPI0011A597CA|nr:ABC transporter substrate-binding protein [Bacillus sp. FJAT-22090]